MGKSGQSCCKVVNLHKRSNFVPLPHLEGSMNERDKKAKEYSEYLSSEQLQKEMLSTEKLLEEYKHLKGLAVWPVHKDALAEIIEEEQAFLDAFKKRQGKLS